MFRIYTLIFEFNVVPIQIFRSFDEGRVPRQIMSLPDYQYNALNTCIAQVSIWNVISSTNWNIIMIVNVSAIHLPR